MSIQTQWIQLFLRIVLGGIMIYYGWQKIRDPAENARDFEWMGFKPGALWGSLITAVEFFGGIAMLLGLYAELAASLFAFQMMVGMFWKLKIKKPFTDYSYDIQLLALSVAMMCYGAGALALTSFPASIFLRWDVALAALLAAVLFAVFSRPHPKSSQPVPS